ncbi:hypothetical protein [Aquimarina sp. AU474]|uniref:hypothetical protein n=1 Tax=Aquimarina sp. AU474 TaxID=2108529 RepID=UPI000D695EC4|nr:hypothetical protein [Aquimarina sp. AU474]
MEKLVIEIKDIHDLSAIKNIILKKLGLFNSNVSYISKNKKILSPIKIDPYKEFEVRMKFFLVNNNVKISLILNCDSIKNNIQERIKRNVYKTYPLEGFHFGMSNMEAQAYCPSYSEEEIRLKELEILNQSDVQYSILERSILELNTKYNIELIYK